MIGSYIARIGLRQRGSHWESLDFVSQRRFEMMIGAERSAAVCRRANNGAYKGSLSTPHYCLSASSVGRMGDGWISSPLVQERFMAAWFMFIVRAPVGRATLATDRGLSNRLNASRRVMKHLQHRMNHGRKNSWCTVWKYVRIISG